MFLQVAALSLLSSLLAHCLNSGRVWLLALFLMNNTGLNHSAPCHTASDWSMLHWHWPLIGCCDESSMVLISLPMGGSESYFTWDALWVFFRSSFSSREKKLQVKYWALLISPGRLEKMKIRNLQAWKYLKPLDKHFPSHSFIILAWVILRS